MLKNILKHCLSIVFFLLLVCTGSGLFTVPAQGAVAFEDLSPEQQEQLKSYQSSLGKNVEETSSQELGTPVIQKVNGGVDTSEAAAKIAPPSTPRPHEFSEAEKYFSATLNEEKKPRDRVVKSLQKLNQFGFEFFANQGDFTADSAALVGSDYVLGPGDTLRIDIWGNIEGNYQVTIDRNGEIVLPKVGVISLWGQTFSQVQETIEKQISKYFKQFRINVSLDSLRAINVFLVGEVEAPGSYQMSALNTVLTALSVAGGPAKTGSLRQVKLIRKGLEIANIDFYDFFRSGDNRQDVRLQSGDTIFVPMAGALVGVSGKVRRPAIYELREGETLGDLIKMAGGTVSTAYLSKVRIERIQDHSLKKIIDVDLTSESTSFSLPLQDHDLVEIASISDNGGYVKLTGFVARPGEYQLTPKLRLADLILSYDNLLPEYFPGLAQIVRYSPPQFRPEFLSVDLDKALNGEPTHNILLQEYDEIKIFSRQQMEEIPQVVISGAILNPGRYPLYDNMTIKDLITLAGNIKRTAYLDEAELTRYLPSGLSTQTDRHVINLKRALENDPQHNLQLLPDDNLIIRSIPDSGEKFFMQVQGEVLFPGSYAIATGERLSSVLARAGGFSDKAYLRGVVFTRDSLKVIQQQRLDKLIYEQEQEINRASLELASGVMDVAQVEAAKLNLENQRQLLQKLKQAPVSGRMVIEIADLEAFKGSGFDVEVVPGDAITIPKNPMSVTVLGQVYNPTSLIYTVGKPVSYYLSKVGGVKGNADDEEMFVVRANGSVISRQQGGFGMRWDHDNWRWVFGGFNAVVLYPGDAILVPEQATSTNYLRTSMDISTIIYQMALGAAAVASF